MAKQQRYPTRYAGVYYVIGQHITDNEKTEHIFYIRYKRDGKLIEEKAGRQYQDGMTAAKANAIRALRLTGRERSNEERRQAKAQDTSRPTLDRLFAAYADEKAQNSSFKDDKSRYANYLQKPFGKLLPAEIFTRDIDKLRNSLLRSGKTPKTTAHIIELLRRLIMFGVKKGHCPQPDPAKLHFELPKVDNVKTESLTLEQIQAVLTALDEEPDQDAAALVRLALFTGARKGALIALKWADLDFDSGFITLRGDSAKSGKTESIPMSPPARAALEAIDRNNGSEFVFPGRDGGQRSDYRRIAKRVRDKAGLPADFRPLHGLRHAFASWLASSGQVDLYTLQKLLTHSSPQMTQRYAHLADDAMHRAAAVTNSMFEKK